MSLEEFHAVSQINKLHYIFGDEFQLPELTVMTYTAVHITPAVVVSAALNARGTYF